MLMMMKKCNEYNDGNDKDHDNVMNVKIMT